jgi:hypothetical protein
MTWNKNRHGVREEQVTKYGNKNFVKDWKVFEKKRRKCGCNREEQRHTRRLNGSALKESVN